MSIYCKLFGHKWNSCKCSRCRETRDEEHIWNGCKCSRCGKTRDEEHNWIPLEGKCIEKCSICGKVHKIEHKWNGCICSICGEKPLSWMAKHDWIKLSNNRQSEEIIRNTSLYFDFSLDILLCKQCNEKKTDRIGMYCPKCDKIGQYYLASDGDYADFQFCCSNCGYKIEKELKHGALGRT